MRRHLFVRAAMAAMVAAAGSCVSEEGAAHIAVPMPEAWTGKATVKDWARIRGNYAEEKKAFAELLVALDGLRSDPGKPNLEQAKADEETLGKETARFAAAVRWLYQARQPQVPNEIAVRLATAPRLSGRIVKVGPKGDYPTLEAALKNVQPGDLICVAAGRYFLPQAKDLKDVALLGEGPERTTLVREGEISNAERLRVAGFKIDCANSPFLDLREGTSAEISNCEIFDYNSGVGGSNGIFGMGCTILADRCVFEGLSGSDAANERRGPGNAFDLRENFTLYAIACRFIDNSEIVRLYNSTAVFDRCKAEKVSNARPWGNNTIYFWTDEGRLWARGSALPFRGGSGEDRTKNILPLPAAAGDLDFLRFVAGSKPAADAHFDALARDLTLERNLPFWIGLLRVSDDGIRAFAAAKVEALTGQTVRTEALAKKCDAAELEALARNLDAEDPRERGKAAERIEALGMAARPLLERLATAGSPEQVLSALDLLERIPLWVDARNEGGMRQEREFARLSEWYRRERDNLIWDELSRRYVLRK